MNTLTAILVPVIAFYCAPAASAKVIDHGPEITKVREIAENLAYSVRSDPDEPEQTVQLKKGRFVHQDPDEPLFVETSPDDPILVVEEGARKTAFVTIWRSGGGTAHWETLKEIQLSPGAPREIKSFPEFKEDRESIKSMSIKGGELVAKVLYHGQNDPLCCPTKGKELRFKL